VGAWTTADLQWLDMNNIHADFFIVLNDWCGDIRQGDPTCEAAITEILTNHNPANHTVDHPHMGTPNSAAAGSKPNGCGDATSCEAELTGVESYIATKSNGARPHLTRFRAPYGEPFQAMSPTLSFVAPVVAKYAVHVGWNLDANDWSYNGTSCAVTPCPTAQDIANNVLAQVGAGPGKGQWGILLMHATYPWTHDALPLLFGPSGEITKRGFRLGTVEDAICWKFGKHSWDIIPNRGMPN
jgi:peptidoglycan/xylan/chitin deacetylase (PgdA/CDA1 family)